FADIASKSDQSRCGDGGERRAAHARLRHLPTQFGLTPCRANPPPNSPSHTNERRSPTPPQPPPTTIGNNGCSASSHPCTPRSVSCLLKRVSDFVISWNARPASLKLNLLSSQARLMCYVARHRHHSRRFPASKLGTRT